MRHLLAVAFALILPSAALTGPPLLRGLAPAPMAAPDAWSDYLVAKAAWDAEVARLQAEYEAAGAQYLLDLAAYATDKAAFDAAVAIADAYPGELEAARGAAVHTFAVAIPPQEALLFSAAWGGPWGYASSLYGWMLGPDAAPVPQGMQDAHRWIRTRLEAAALSLAEWDAHVAAVGAYEILRWPAPVVPPEPVPPVQPVPPVFPPAPIPPTIVPATITATPTSWTALSTGLSKASSNPILDVWNAAKPGDVVQLAAGDFRRADLKASSRPSGSARVTFRGDRIGRTRITTTPVVGGSDTLQLAHGVSDSAWEDIDFLAASRAGIKTVASQRADGSWWGTGSNHTFKGCRVLGGWNPTVPSGPGPDDVDPTNTMWGVHLYAGGNFLFEDCTFQGIYSEHLGGYGHNNQGDYTYRRCVFRWSGRTATQWMARTSEGPIAAGNITIEDCEATDVCLEQQGGGSAFTFRGGAPNTIVRIVRTKVRLGCDPALISPWNKSVTGAVAMDSGALAYPGGTKELHLVELDSEVGSVWPGEGSARRANVSVKDCGLLVIDSCRIVQGPAAQQIAIEIAASVGRVEFRGENVVVGKVKYRGVEYANLAAFRAAFPSLFSRLDLVPIRDLRFSPARAA